MRNLKKFLTIVIAAVLATATFCLSASAATTKFTDVNAKDEYLTKAVSMLSYLGVAKGTTDTTFGTNQNVTRQQMAAFIYRLMKSGKSLEGGDNTTSFTDLEDDTYYAYISWANSTGVIKGRSDTEFDPEGPITLQDAYTMMIRAMGYEKDTELAYPHGYIDLAESTDVELDEGLPSSVSYEKSLTRGNVAVILYNAFFGKTGYVETEKKEKLIGSGANQKWVLETKEYNPTIAEYVYDVEEAEFMVRATPHYAFNDTESSSEYEPLNSGFDVDTLHFVAQEADEKVQSFYYDFSNLEVGGKADDYIMSVFTVYYTLDKDDKIDQILYANPEMNKIAGDAVTLGKVSASKTSDYFGGDKSYPKLDGSATVGTAKMYFFDAPYSYIKPSYGTITDEADRYALRNEKDVKLIGYKQIDDEDGTYGYYITDDSMSTAEELAVTLNQVYTNGIYKVEVFDVDGDNAYEYMRYMPYCFGQMNEDEDYTFADVDDYYNQVPVNVRNTDTNSSAVSTIPTIYYNEADLSGEAFSDEDFVIAYLNPEANQIDVFTVIKPVQGTVSYVNGNTCTVTCNGKQFRTCYAYLTVKGFSIGGETDNDASTTINTGVAKTNTFRPLISASALGKDFKVYAYNKNYNNVYFYEPLSDSGSSYSAGDGIIIPLEDTDGNKGITTPSYNSKTSQNDQYLKVWIDGEEKFVPVNVSDIYPKPTRVQDSYDFNVNVTEKDGKSYPAYIGRICTYTKDSDGLYVITPLLHSRDEDGVYNGVNNDPKTLVEDDNDDQYGRDLYYYEEARIKKVAGTRYQLVDNLGLSLLGTDSEQYVNYFVMQDYSKIIIRNYNTASEEYEYMEYDAKSFAGTTSEDTMLTNVQYIIKGDPDSTTRADLVLLFGDAVDFEFENKTSSGDWRIIKSFTPNKDDNDYYRYYYDLYDPFTGKVVEDVAGSKTASSSSALEEKFDVGVSQFVKVTAAGLVDESKTSYDSINLTDNTKLAFITDYAAEDKVLEIQPVNEEDEGEFIRYKDEEFLYQVTDDTVVTLLTFEKKNDFASATIKLLTAADLNSNKSEYKCYNDKYQAEGSDKYTTKYAKNQKCYISYTEKTDDMPEVDFIVILVHPDENTDYLDIK